MFHNYNHATVLLKVWLLLLMAAVVRSQVIMESSTPPQDCRLDICFILDESGSVGRDNFVTVKNFTNKFVGRLPIGEQLTRVGVVKFSSSSALSFGLTAHIDKNRLQQAISNLTYAGGSTNLGQGLIVARTKCFNTTGDRPDVPNVAILVTDGKPNNGPKSELEARYTREAGIDIVAIGVGNIDFNFLYGVANGKQNVFEVNFTTLVSTVENIQSQSCTYAKECPKGSFAYGSTLLSCPKLHNPSTNNTEKDILFTCSLNYSSVVPSTTRYRVTFMFDGQVDPNVPTTTIEPPGKTATLHEYYLQGHLGKSLSCAVQVYALSETPGTYVFSRSYRLGIFFSDNVHNIFESDALPTNLYFYNTLPIGCVDPRSCHLKYGIVTAGHIGVVQEDRLNNLKRCEMINYDKEWISDESLTYNASRPLYVFPKGDPFHGTDRESSITLVAKASDKQYTVNGQKKAYSIWKDYTIDPVKVIVHDSPHCRCTAWGDPHLKTCDGRKYDIMLSGIFSYVKAQGNRDYQVQVRHLPCDDSGRACAWACAVTVQDGPYVYALDNCGDDETHFSGPLLLHEPDEVDEGVGIFGKLNDWEIRTLSGVVISVHINWRGINLDIQVPARDHSKLQGVCGNFDGNPGNDITDHDRIPLEKSLFFEFSENNTRGVNSSTNVCDCSRPGAVDTNKEACGLRALQDSTLTPDSLKKRARALKPRYLTNHGQGGRRRKRSIPDADVILRDEDINEDYYPRITNDIDPVSNEPPDWGTFNISESEARALCGAHVQNIPNYEKCSTKINATQNIDICMDDIRRSGDLNWVNATDSKFLGDCRASILNSTKVTNRDDPMSDPVFSADASIIINTVCATNCAQHGTCVNGKCQCQNGYFGSDCSLTTSTVPRLRNYLGPEVCDIQVRTCTSVRLQADDLVDTDDLTCRTTVEYSDGSTQSEDAAAELQTKYNVLCPLPDLLNLTDNTAPYYKYRVTLSNDGNRFSAKLSANRVVLDSTCMDCDSAGCTQKDDTCAIDGHCYEPDELHTPNDACYMCIPSASQTAWSVQPGDKPVLTSKDSYFKVAAEDLSIDLSGNDPYGSGVTFALVNPVVGLTLKSSGELMWTKQYSESFARVPIHIQAEACPRVKTEELVLTLIDCSGICGNGDCVPEPNELRGQGKYVCDCFVGFTGSKCETNLDDCASDPCKNGGSCVDGDNKYECRCVAGYTGADCETDIDECLSGPCQNGTCDDHVNKYSCSCVDGYTGVNCDIDIDECSTNPCRNNGTCIDGINKYSCICADGYSGTLCEDDIDECSSKPCQNGGSCVDEVNHYICKCVPGYTGENCETDIDECSSTPCENGGTCTDDVNMYSCACVAGYTGINCESDMDECSPNPCHKGSCKNEINKYTCVCSGGYTGVNCTIDIDECLSNPCQNGATCRNEINEFSCICPDGYTGTRCETDIDECASKPCLHGECSDHINMYSCSCMGGYTGKNCDTNIDECSSNPCRNKGACTDRINKYSCTCADGYSGTLCEEDIDECSSKPCQNGGSCDDKVNSYICKCVPGYTGENCETDTDECSSAPCKNGGMCVNGVNKYTCNCAAGFTDTNCETNINECSSRPCKNGGTCNDGINGYQCDCDDGYSGTNCQINIDECLTASCLHGGSCVDGVNSYTCQCAPGYTDSRCGTNINECASSPCFNSGTCEDQVNQYICHCASGYTGRICETNIDECESSPCQNGGNCLDDVNMYTCTCLPGYAGIHCDIDVDECASAPCNNGGDCKDQVNSFKCICPAGYTGVLCDTNIDECSSSPCVHGSCTDRIDGYICSCEAGYSGSDCHIDINECASTPCVHGQCTDKVNAYSCSCEPGYSGTNCAIDVDECAPLPCVHGVCTDKVNKYECSCEPGYSGNNCQTNIDECSSSPCVHGTCLDRVDSYLCQCLPGYHGVDCNLETNECDGSPCVHGRCEDQLNGYQCVCKAGYAGMRCDVDIDDCAQISCGPGVCLDGINSFTCVCNAGFTGTLCTINIDECKSSPCKHGSCIDNINSYTCKCNEHYTGTHCEGQVDYCSSDPCQNAGTCSKKLGGYNCLCGEDYTGRHCETRLPDIGTFGEWSAYGPCSKTCDYGLRVRSRLCLREPCDVTKSSEKQYCAKNNCPEKPGDSEVSSTISFSGKDIEEVVSSLPDVQTTATDVLNAYCSSHVDECCTAVDLRTKDNPQNMDKMFKKENVEFASGYPKVADDGQIQLLLKVEVSLSQLADVCIITSRRRKRQIEDLRTVDKSLVERSMKDGEEVFIQRFGSGVTVNQGTADTSSLRTVYIAGGVAGGVLLVVGLALVVYAVCVRCNRGDQDDKIEDERSHYYEASLPGYHDNQHHDDRHGPRWFPSWRGPKQIMHGEY